MAARLREFVVHVAKTLAEQPERVQVEEVDGAAEGAAESDDDTDDDDGPRGSGARMRLVVAPDDVGRIVGRRGRTAKAIRTLLAAAGDCDLEIVGPAGDGDGDDEVEDEDSEPLDD